MGPFDFPVEMIVIFIIFTYENAVSILVPGFLCWFLGRMGSVNAAIPRFLPEVLHLCAAVLFASVGLVFTFFFLLRGGWFLGMVVGICACLSGWNLWHMLLVPRRISAEEAFFEGSPPDEGSLPEPKEVFPEPEDRSP